MHRMGVRREQVPRSGTDRLFANGQSHDLHLEL
jgi:hypothetical protein